ncbi:MAG: hypothetical protein PWR24_1811 [Desulfonauticus sp.]|nr:hypothetical protein [Desulfonauticus sp.]
MIYVHSMNFDKLIKYSIYSLAGVILVLFCFLKPIGFDPDSLQYVSVLEYSPAEYVFSLYEPLHWGIVYINSLLFNSNPHTFFLIYGIIYVFLSLYAISKFSVNPFFSLLIFILLVYPNYGLIQVRQGVALAILWLSIDDIIRGNYKKLLLKGLFATAFHYSSIILLILVLIAKKIQLKFGNYILILLVAIVLIKFISLEYLLIIINKLEFLNIYPFLSLPIIKLQNYIQIKLSDEELSLNKINLINLYTLTNFFFISLSLFFLKLSSKKRDIYLLFYNNVLIIGLLIFSVFSFLPVLSFRIFYPLSSFLVFLIPYLLRKFEPVSLAFFIFLMLILINSINTYIYGGLFKFNIIFE